MNDIGFEEKNKVIKLKVELVCVTSIDQSVYNSFPASAYKFYSFCKMRHHIQPEDLSQKFLNYAACPILLQKQLLPIKL